jgi:putative salt-induced outer membrane protein YdiY
VSFTRCLRVFALLTITTVSPVSLHAQSTLSLPGAPSVPSTEAQPAPAPEGPPPLWLVSAGAGLAVTGGNTDTSTINVAYEVKRDGGLPLVYRSAGVYLRGKTDDELTVDRALLDNRVERKLTERVSAFGQFGYLRDRFKEIDYLLSPGGGITYAFVKNSRVELNGDGGAGVIFEKNTGFDLETSGSVLAAQRFLFNFSDTASVTQSIAALWKMDDFEDSLYAFSVGVVSSLTANSQVKVELLDTFKNRPVSEDVEKNDISLLVSLVYKFRRQ